MMQSLHQSLSELLSADRVYTDDAHLAAYESDGLTAFKAKPRAVVVPETAEEVISLVRWCHEHEVPFVARGSGTSLSGGSLPVDRKSTRLNSSHKPISSAVFCLKKKRI